jgi:enterochelin esterase-like enzyme
MKKLLLAFLIVLGIGLAGIVGWTLSSTHQSQAKADEYVQWTKNQKFIPIDFAITAPAGTPGDQTLYISGDSAELGDWDAAGVPLHHDNDGKYRTTVSILSGIPHKFKVTRGTWGTVERAADGSDIPDHDFVGTPSVAVEATVGTWVDGGKSTPGKVTMTGDIRLHKKFESKLLDNSRTIIVYLPPGYETQTDARYPVLYMQDGQNLFDSATAYAGIEWGVDESAQKLITEKRIEPVIIVGIYNTPDRTAEFTPFDKTPGGVAGKGALYERFIIEEVKPMIDRTYRTMPDAAHTAIGGASEGGLITLAAAHDHPEVCGSVAVLDPWLRDSAHPLLDTWKDKSWMKGKRFYADMGTKGDGLYPGTTEVDDLNQLIKQFDSAGLKKGTDYLAGTVEGAEHGETAWQQRVPNFLLFLYGQK